MAKMIFVSPSVVEATARPAQDMGPMNGRRLEDFDGHAFEPMRMGVDAFTAARTRTAAAA